MRHEISINVKSTEIHAPNDLKILFKTIDEVPLETMAVLTSTMNTIQSVSYIIEIVVATSRQNIELTFNIVYQNVPFLNQIAR
jgi:hypothetical protein